jgi:hypothetical protein
VSAEGDQTSGEAPDRERPCRSKSHARQRRRRKRSGGCRFEGSARSARLGRLLRQDQAVTGEDAEAQAKFVCGVPGRRVTG